MSRFLDQLARRSGQFEDLLLARGAIYFSAGKIDLAITEFAEAISIYPGLHLAHYNLGIALGAKARYAEAAEALQRALAVDPTHSQTHFHLALALKAANRTEEAREGLRALNLIDAEMAGDLAALIGMENALQ